MSRDADDILLALFLAADREGVTAEELKRAIEKVRDEWRDGAYRVSCDGCRDDD